MLQVHAPRSRRCKRHVQVWTQAVCNVHYFEIYLSASEGQEFLASMSKTTESDCDCLPDCDLLDLQYSVSSADLMWALLDSLQALGLKVILILTPFLRHCDSRNLNLSPLCKLGSGPFPALWTDRVGRNCRDAFSNQNFRWTWLTRRLTARFPPTFQLWPTLWGESTKTTFLPMSHRYCQLWATND